METPRRIRLDLNKPAELAIRNTIDEVEKIGADVRLTNAVIKLQEALDLVSDFIDEEIILNSTPEDPPKDPPGGGG